MRLKIIKVDASEMKRNDNKESEISERIRSVESFRGETVFIFSVFIKTRVNSIGAQNRTEKKFVGLEDVMDDLNYDLYKCRFYIVDTLKKNLYYDGSMDDVKLILKDFFDIEWKQISLVVDRDELVKVKSLKITTKSEGQMVLNEPLNPEIESIDKMFQSDRIKTRTYEIGFSAAGSKLMKRDLFDKMLDDSEKSRSIITVQGFDKDGQQVRLGSRISKRIEILETTSSFEDKMGLPLSKIYEALKEVADI